MSESDIYRSGYAEAVSDVCKMFDSMHDRYTALFNVDGDNTRELEKLEVSLVTLNSVIYHLNTRLMGRKGNGKDE